MGLSHSNIGELHDGDTARGYYLLKDADIKSSKDGKQYLAGTITDNSGSIDFKMWSYAGPISKKDSGTIIYTEGLVKPYLETLQFTATVIRQVTPSDIYDLDDIIPTAPIDVNAVIKEIKSTIDSMDDMDYRAICREILNVRYQDFITIPAAKAFHHSFKSGLLMHTYNMMRTAEYLSGIYKDVIDRDLLVAGTLLHDIGKIEEFAVSELGLVSDYSEKGKLMGHLVIGADIIKEAADKHNVPEEKALLLQHMLLSHHGTPEFGACVRPLTAEAELLSWIDMIDSRMEIYSETFRNMEPGEFSERLFALDNRSIFNHK